LILWQKHDPDMCLALKRFTPHDPITLVLASTQKKHLLYGKQYPTEEVNS